MTVFDLPGYLTIEKAYVDNHLTDNNVQSTGSNIQPEYKSDGDKQILTYLDSLNVFSTKTIKDIVTAQADVKTILDTEKTRLGDKKNLIDAEFNQRERLTKLFESNRLRNSQYTKLMIVIFLTGFVIFILYQIQNYYSSFIPEFVYEFCIFILLTLSIVYCYFLYMEIIYRDNMNYNELNLNDSNNQSVNSNTHYGQNVKEITKIMPNSDLLAKFASTNQPFCIGSSCCAGGTTWNTDSNTCVKTL